MSLRSSSGNPVTGKPAGGPADRRLVPRKRKNFLGPQPLGLLFSAPYVIYVLAVLAFPLGYAVYISFHDFFFTAPRVKVDRPFVGFENYITVLSDPAVQRSFLNIGVFMIINVPLTVALSLLLANALNRVTRLKTFFRLSYYVPYVTASVAVVGVWLFLFQQNGLLNTLLGPLAPAPSWLVNSWLAMPTVALYVTWKQLGFFILLYLAALQNIPTLQYEAAAVDGAGPWRQLFSITLPQLGPVTGVILILQMLASLKLFDQAYQMMNGNSSESSRPIVQYIFEAGFVGYRFGYASAISYIFFVLIVLVGIAQMIVLRRRKEDS